LRLLKRLQDGVIDPTCRDGHDPIMRFEILGEITDIEAFATGSGIREIARLRRIYGRGRWRKRKGVARVRLSDGTIHFGMKLPASAARNSRSSTCFENHDQDTSKATRRVHQQ
jgi:hypothetical protein